MQLLFLKVKSNIQMNFSCLKNVTVILLVFLFAGCQKEMATLLPLQQETGMQTSTRQQLKTAVPFTTYTILAGQQYCEGNNYPPYSTLAMRFTVRFDSSDIYTNQLASNQYDYNKLYGFSDNNSDHHNFSARFGWRWCNGAIELSAYTYNDGIRSIKDLGSIDIKKEHLCAILVSGNHYDFVLDGVTTSVPRTSKTKKGIGYKLLPYFGGDEVAPHAINIQIKETK